MSASVGVTNFDEWLKDFVVGKRRVGSSGQLNEHAVHSVERYLDGDGLVWEFALTYTDRLVVRSGTVGKDGVTIEWGNWQTKHDVNVQGKQEP